MRKVPFGLMKACTWMNQMNEIGQAVRNDVPLPLVQLFYDDIPVVGGPAGRYWWPANQRLSPADTPAVRPNDLPWLINRYGPLVLRAA